MPFSVKYFILFFTVLFSFSTGFSQNEKQIDKINAIVIHKSSISSDSLAKLFSSNIKNALKTNYQKGMADGYLKLSIVLYYQGKYEENLKNTLEAIRIYEELKDVSKIAKTYAELGYQMKRRNMDKAIFYMQKGKSLAEKNELNSELKNIYNNYGVLKEMMQELDSALFYYHEGLSIKETENDSLGIPYSLSNIGGVYLLKSDYNNAIKFLNLSMKYRLQLKDSIGLAENYTNLAEVYFKRNNFSETLSLVENSLTISKKKEIRYLTQYNYQFKSKVYKKLKNTDSALFYFEKFYAHKDSITNLEVQDKLAKYTVEFEMEKKEKEILQQRALLAENELAMKKKNQLIFGSFGLAFVLGLLGYLLYNQQKLKNNQIKRENELKTALVKIETQNKLQEQRLRISRDLHDNIGSHLTFIISSLDSLKYKFKDFPASESLTGISGFTKQTIYELRDTIWAMNKNDISFEDLQIRISNFIEQAKIASNETTFNFNIAENVNKLHVFSSVEGMNLYRIIQEAVNNASKYANSTEISVTINETESHFTIAIIDQGKGFNMDKVKLGNGISNIKKRTKDIKGKVSIKSKVDKGTSIIIELPN